MRSMRRRLGPWAAWLTTMALGLAGCGGGGGAPATQGPAATPASVDATPTGAVSANSPATHALIGPAGGQLSSADGRLTVDVPAGAFSQDQPLAIQAIDNQAHGGVGRAYRITPEGLHTTVPMTLRFQVGDTDLIGTTSAYLGVAFQDGQGLWHAVREHTLDTASQTLSVHTTHFSDWSMFAGLQLRPPEATVHVGQTLQLQVKACEQVVEDGIVSLLHRCQTWDAGDRGIFWSVNGVLGGGAQIGTVAALDSTEVNSDAVYTAPPRLGQGHSMVVAVSAELFDPLHPDDNGHSIMVSNVTVEDELARSCEWLRTAGDLDFDIAITPANYSASDGYGTHVGQQRAHITGRLQSQAQSQALGWWTAKLDTIAGEVAIHNRYDSPDVATTTDGEGAPYVSDGTPRPDNFSTGVVLYVDYSQCTYTLSTGLAATATVRSQSLRSEGPPTVTTGPVRVGTLGVDQAPLYASYAVLHSIHAERELPILTQLGTGEAGYAPDAVADGLQSGGDIGASWTLKPVP